MSTANVSHDAPASEPIEALSRAKVVQTLTDVMAVAEGRTDAYWAGFQQAVEEIATRLHLGVPDAGAEVGSSRALLARAEHNAETLERLSCEADDKGQASVAAIYQKSADTIRSLIVARWGDIPANQRYELLREHEHLIATGEARPIHLQ